MCSVTPVEPIHSSLPLTVLASASCQVGLSYANISDWQALAGGFIDACIWRFSSMEFLLYYPWEIYDCHETPLPLVIVSCYHLNCTLEIALLGRIPRWRRCFDLRSLHRMNSNQIPPHGVVFWHFIWGWWQDFCRLCLWPQWSRCVVVCVMMTMTWSRFVGYHLSWRLYQRIDLLMKKWKTSWRELCWVQDVVNKSMDVLLSYYRHEKKYS